jgi:nicotinamidase-related amidase
VPNKSWRKSVRTPFPLIVVDMQASFKKVDDPILLGNVKKHVYRAIKKNTPIVLVEYNGKGKTHPHIMAILDDYENYEIVRKKEWDGSRLVTKVLRNRWGIKPQRTVRMCGLYTHACVAKTAEGLSDEGYKVRVIEEACYAAKDNHLDQLEEWEKTKILKITYKNRVW